MRVQGAPALRRFIDGPELQRREFKAAGNRLADIEVGGFAVFEEIEGAGRGFAQGQQVELGDIQDMHVGPTVHPCTDDAHYAVFLRLLHQPGNLHAFLMYARTCAVDGAGADHHREDVLLGGGQYLELDITARLLGGRHHKRRVFIEHTRVHVETLCVIADYAGTAGVQKGFARARERLDKGLDGGQVIAVGGMNDRFGCHGFAVQQVEVVETADHRLDPRGFHLACLFFVTDQTTDGVAGPD